MLHGESRESTEPRARGASSVGARPMWERGPGAQENIVRGSRGPRVGAVQYSKSDSSGGVSHERHRPPAERGQHVGGDPADRHAAHAPDGQLVHRRALGSRSGPSGCRGRCHNGNQQRGSPEPHGACLAGRCRSRSRPATHTEEGEGTVRWRRAVRPRRRCRLTPGAWRPLGGAWTCLPYHADPTNQAGANQCILPSNFGKLTGK